MATVTSTADFRAEVSEKALGRNLPQRMGGRLWLPMMVMALMFFIAAVALALIRANEIAGLGDEKTIAALGQFVPPITFLGFLSVFLSVVFAIARILGEFRVGAGQVQEATGAKVKVLSMPGTAKAMVALMVMGMMVILGSVALHIIAGVAVADGDLTFELASDQWTLWLEGARRTGIGLYLLSITFGLASIVNVLRFASMRVRELPDEAAKAKAAPRRAAQLRRQRPGLGLSD